MLNLTKSVYAFSRIRGASRSMGWADRSVEMGWWVQGEGLSNQGCGRQKVKNSQVSVGGLGGKVRLGKPSCLPEALGCAFPTPTCPVPAYLCFHSHVCFFLFCIASFVSCLFLIVPVPDLDFPTHPGVCSQIPHTVTLSSCTPGIVTPLACDPFGSPSLSLLTFNFGILGLCP